MKLLAVADIHGKEQKLQLIAEQIQTHQPDYLVVAGDIINYFRPTAFISKLSRLPVPILAVRGNSDPKSVDREMAKYNTLTNLHLHEIEIGAIPVVGISGTALLPFHSKVRLFESALLERLAAVLKPGGILVAHPPPRRTVDKVGGKFHAGSKGLAAIIKALQPGLVICGHIHEDPGIATVGKTKVVNCSIGGEGLGALVEIAETKEIDVTML